MELVSESHMFVKHVGDPLNGILSGDALPFFFCRCIDTVHFKMAMIDLPNCDCQFIAVIVDHNIADFRRTCRNSHNHVAIVNRVLIQRRLQRVQKGLSNTRQFFRHTHVAT